MEEQEVSAQFGDPCGICAAAREVTYDYADLNEITLAFATTIHKAQGSEYPVVILPVFMQHYMMLSPEFNLHGDYPRPQACDRRWFIEGDRASRETGERSAAVHTVGASARQFTSA